MAKTSEKVKALITYANGVTGAEDTTLGDAVKTLADGYGQGGEEYLECVKAILEEGENVVIPEGITAIRNYAFYNNKKVNSITIPSLVTSIGDYAFYYCSALNSITIPSLVTSIGDCAFYRCNSLASIILPEGLVSIGQQAIAYISNTEFKSIIIPSTVTSIGTAAFRNTYIATFQCNAVTPPTLGNYNAFSTYADEIKILVPADSVNAYKNASQWSNVSYAIQAIEE